MGKGCTGTAIENALLRHTITRPSRTAWSLPCQMGDRDEAKLQKIRTRNPHGYSEPGSYDATSDSEYAETGSLTIELDSVVRFPGQGSQPPSAHRDGALGLAPPP